MSLKLREVVTPITPMRRNPRRLLRVMVTPGEVQSNVAVRARKESTKGKRAKSTNEKDRAQTKAAEAVGMEEMMGYPLLGGRLILPTPGSLRSKPM